MTSSRVVLAVLIRVVGLTAVDLAYLHWLDADTSTDALGAGFLFFALVMLVALLWAFVDAVRRGFLSTVGLWVVTSALSGVTFTLVFAEVTDDQSGDWAFGVVFFGGLLLVAALVGAVVGGLVYRVRVAVRD